MVWLTKGGHFWLEMGAGKNQSTVFVFSFLSHLYLSIPPKNLELHMWLSLPTYPHSNPVTVG